MADLVRLALVLVKAMVRKVVSVSPQGRALRQGSVKASAWVKASVVLVRPVLVLGFLVRVRAASVSRVRDSVMPDLPMRA